MTITESLILLSMTMLFAAAVSHEHGDRNRPGLSLRETFDLYVKSVQNSDLQGLFSIVTDGEDFFFLTARGELVNSREGYYRFHDEWFRQTDWEMPVELSEVREGKDYGYTRAIFHYRAKTPQGGLYSLDSYFTLIFHKEDGMWKVVADICTPISRSVSEENPQITYTPEQMYVFDVMAKRRTVRRFKPTRVPREHIMKILDAARFAPTAGNQQPWKFLVLQDRETLNRLQTEAIGWHLADQHQGEGAADQEQSEHGQEGIVDVLRNALSAPVCVVILVDSRAGRPSDVLQDGTLGAGYLMIAARALGYGTGFYRRFFPEKKMRELFNIPEQYRLICLAPIGIPEEWSEVPLEKDLDEIVAFEAL